MAETSISKLLGGLHYNDLRAACTCTWRGHNTCIYMYVHYVHVHACTIHVCKGANYKSDVHVYMSLYMYMYMYIV